MTWKDKLIPGFMGEAMRKTQLESVVKEEDMELSTNPLKKKKKKADTNKTEEFAKVIVPDVDNIDMKTDRYEEKINEIMTELASAKVFSGKNGQELEDKINSFLVSNPSIDVVDTNFGTSIEGVYYTLLYKSKVERV